MVKTTIERVEERIEDQVVRFRELTNTRRVLRAQIDKADAEKRSVKDRVFQRVQNDYRRRLEETERELGPIAAAVQEARASIQSEIRESDIRTEEIQDKIDEIAFRHRVGEYDADSSNHLQAPLADEYERLVQRRRALSELLARVDEREDEFPSHNDNSRAEAPGQNAQPREPSPSPVAPPPEPQPLGKIQADGGQDASATDTFVDPTEWIGEFVVPEPPTAEREARSGAAAEATKHVDALDNLSELADPSEGSSTAPSAVSSRTAERRIDLSERLPILAVVSGPAAGKRLPLLPITMTLGREVDNNIEIKDIDVARYHARISFEAGHYTIQDLEGSSGTFVDGQRISKTVLTPGSSIRVGNSELKVELC